jgi:hypothetical protein
MMRPMCTETYALFAATPHRCSRYLGQGRKGFLPASIHHCPIRRFDILQRRAVIVEAPFKEGATHSRQKHSAILIGRRAV